MNKLRLYCVSWLGLVVAGTLFSAPGDIVVSLESSVDQVSWSSSSAGTFDVSSSEPYMRVKIVPLDGGQPEHSDSIQLTTTYPGKNVIASLSSSTDLSSWGSDATGTQNVSGGKKFWQVSSRTSFTEFIDVPAGTMDAETMDPLNVAAFRIGKYEVTLEEWNYTYLWAIENGYTFNATHDGCNLNHPVQNISWYDAAKWCNARSQQEGLTPVYYTDGTQTNVYQTGQIFLLDGFVDTAADGYRLPTLDEWEFAARGAGIGPDDYIYSGSDTALDVARYQDNSDGAECDYGVGKGTFPVGTLDPNDLGTYDMSGNIAEFVFDYSGSTRFAAGGSWIAPVGGVQTTSTQSINPVSTNTYLGFRLAMNVPTQAALFEASTTDTTTSFPRKSRKGKSLNKAVK